MIHNFCTKYGKILEICKQYSKKLSNISCNHGKNIPPPPSIHHIKSLTNGQRQTAGSTAKDTSPLSGRHASETSLDYSKRYIKIFIKLILLIS